MTTLYSLWVLAVCTLLPWIESKRYEFEYGKKKNLNKGLTVLIAAVVWMPLGFAAQLSLTFVAACLALRGLFWDPSLNIFLKRHIDEERTTPEGKLTTNSLFDRLERWLKIPFWWQRFIYLLLSAFFIWLQIKYPVYLMHQ